MVEILGQSPTRIDYVTGTILQGGADQTAQFLAFVASLPYDGADPPATQAWVRENAGQDAERVVGGVKIRLAGAGDGGERVGVSGGFGLGLEQAPG